MDIAKYKFSVSKQIFDQCADSVTRTSSKISGNSSDLEDEADDWGNWTFHAFFIANALVVSSRTDMAFDHDCE